MSPRLKKLTFHSVANAIQKTQEQLRAARPFATTVQRKKINLAIRLLGKQRKAIGVACRGAGGQRLFIM
ncbi:MAG: hypothetical protein HY046_13210 [Acidobacteria bacterium]|nr:hypothetical protein [Acidobacteriota bacterium]